MPSPCPRCYESGPAAILRLFVAFVAIASFGSCRSPLFQSWERVDVSLSFSVPDFYRPDGGRDRDADENARVILPNSKTLTVTLTPVDASAQSPSSVSIPVVVGTACSVRFESVALGSYTVTAEAKDSSGTVVFRQTADADVSATAVGLSLSLVPVAPAGVPFSMLEPGIASSGEISPGASVTMTIPAGPAFVILDAPDGVGLFCQGSDGEIMNRDPASRRAIGADTGIGFATIYNAGEVSAPYSLSFGSAPLVARWRFDECTESENDYDDSVGGLVPTVSGDESDMETYPGSGYRSHGALSQYGSAYLAIPDSSYGELEAPWTVAAWVRPNESETVLPLLSGTSGNGFYIAKGPSFSIAITAGGKDFAFPATIGGDAGWTHVALVNTGSELSLYVNGEKDGPSIVDTEALAMPLPLSMLAGDVAGNAFVGMIDDVAVYQSALSAIGVAGIYSSSARVLSLQGCVHGSIGANPDKEYYDIGESVTLTAIPDDATWEFDAWTGDAGGTATSVTILMDGDKTVGATFSTAVPRYTLRYDANGGTYVGTGYMGTAEPTDVSDIVGGETLSVHSSGCSVVQTEDPAKYFTGWNTDPDGLGDHYLPGASIVVEVDTTLFAEWRVDDAPGVDDRAGAPVIDATSVTTAVRTSGYSQFYPNPDGSGKDMDYFKIVVPEGVNGTILLTLEGVSPALFTATICDEDLSGYSGTGWNTDGTYIPASKTVAGGSTYYVYVYHQNQAYHNGPIRTGSYTVITTFTPGP